MKPGRNAAKETPKPVGRPGWAIAMLLGALVVLGALVGFASMIASAGSPRPSQEKLLQGRGETELQEFTGRITLTGSEANVRPALRCEDGEILSLTGHLSQELAALQGFELLVIGVRYDSAAPGLWPVLRVEEYRFSDPEVVAGIVFYDTHDDQEFRESGNVEAPLLLTVSRGNFRLTGPLVDLELEGLPAGTKVWVKGKIEAPESGEYRSIDVEAFGVVWKPA